MEEYDDVLNESHHGSFDEQEFLREILEEQPENLSPQRENICSTSPTNSTVSFDEAISFNYASGSTLHKSNSSNSIKSLKRSSSSSVSPASTTTYLLSFDTSIVEPITLKPSPKLDLALGSSNKRSTSTVTVVKDGCEFEPLMMPQSQARKKVRRSCETQHHIIAERKRRQELTGSIIALAATIPGLKRVSTSVIMKSLFYGLSILSLISFWVFLIIFLVLIKKLKKIFILKIIKNIRNYKQHNFIYFKKIT